MDAVLLAIRLRKEPWCIANFTRLISPFFGASKQGLYALKWWILYEFLFRRLCTTPYHLIEIFRSFEFESKSDIIVHVFRTEKFQTVRFATLNCSNREVLLQTKKSLPQREFLKEKSLKAKRLCTFCNSGLQFRSGTIEKIIERNISVRYDASDWNWVETFSESHQERSVVDFIDCAVGKI